MMLLAAFVYSSLLHGPVSADPLTIDCAQVLPTYRSMQHVVSFHPIMRVSFRVVAAKTVDAVTFERSFPGGAVRTYQLHGTFAPGVAIEGRVLDPHAPSSFFYSPAHVSDSLHPLYVHFTDGSSWHAR